MDLTTMPSALLAFRLRRRLGCQKQVGAGDRGRSAKIYASLFFMNTYSVAVTCLIFAAVSSLAQEVKYDVGQRVHVPGRNASGKAWPVTLGTTGFQANLLVSHYTDEDDADPDFVSITVEKINEKGSTVYFEREFPANAVSKSILNSHTKDVTVFNEHLRTVYFDIDGQVFRYVIPN